MLQNEKKRERDREKEIRKIDLLTRKYYTFLKIYESNNAPNTVTSG